MYRRLLITLALVALASALCTASTAAEPEAATSTGITVTGHAEVTGQPDIAYVTLTVTNLDRDPAKAAQTNANTASAVIGALVKAGIPKNDIQTTQYSVNLEMDYRKSPPTTVGYRVTNSVRVKTRDIKRVGSIIDTAIAAGANEVQSVSFGIEDDTPLRQQALAQAVKNAQIKAMTIADALGVKVGPVRSVTESSGVTPPRPLMYGAAMKAEAAPTPIVPGELQVSADVTITYIINYR